jgi:hypothetical protein
MSTHPEKQYLHVPPVGTSVRSTSTGDLFKIVRDSDGLWIQRDIPNSTQRFVATQICNFVVEKRPELLPPGSMARVAYEADRALCEVSPALPRQKEWLSLDARTKAAWVERRVAFKDSHLLRMKLHNAVNRVLQELETERNVEDDKKEE